MGYCGVMRGSRGGNFHGVGAIFPKGGAFAGLGDTAKKAALAKSNALAKAKAKSKSKGVLAADASKLLGFNIMPALNTNDPDVTAWFAAYCAAIAAGTSPPPAPASVIAGGHKAADAAPPGQGLTFLASLTTGQKAAGAFGALALVVATGVALTRKKSSRASSHSGDE